MRDTDGFALLAALWIVVGVGVVSAEWAAALRMQRVAALNAIDAPQARAAAEGGVVVAHAHLDRLLWTARPRSPGPPASGVADPWHGSTESFADSTGGVAGARWRVALSDAGHRLHLNRVTDAEFRRFLVALGIDAGVADGIAQAMADWRDEDEYHRPHGAERGWYEAAGKLVLPRNGPFGSVAELRHVRDVTPEVYERVRPYLTVCGSGHVNLMGASRPVLLSLPGMSEEAAAVVERMRRRGLFLPTVDALADQLHGAARESLLANRPGLERRTVMQASEILVESEGRAVAGAARVRVEAIVRRDPGAPSMTWVETCR